MILRGSGSHTHSLAFAGKITAPDRSRGEGDGSGAVPGPVAFLLAVLRACFELCKPLFQGFQPFARTSQNLVLNIEFFAGYEIEAAKSLRQNVFEVGLHVLTRLRQPWRNQRCQPLCELIDTLHIHLAHLDVVDEF
jgi:hypothetical protein